LFGCKDGVQGRVRGTALREVATISFQQNAKNRKNRATKITCGNMAPSKNIIRKRWFPHHGSAIEQRPTIQPTLLAPPSSSHPSKSLISPLHILLLQSNLPIGHIYALRLTWPLKESSKSANTLHKHPTQCQQSSNSSAWRARPPW